MLLHGFIIVFVVIVLTICIEISAHYNYKYISRNKENASVYDYVYQRKNF